jgi:hypothetical protein
MHLQKLQVDGRAALFARLSPCPVSLFGIRIDQLLLDRWRLLGDEQAALMAGQKGAKGS